MQMTFLDFDAFSETLFEDIRKMSGTKGKEYAAGAADRFANFTRLAARTKVDRKIVWLIFFTKHLDAIESYIREGKTFSSEPIRGRIVDAMTYLALLAGMIKDEESK
jgi:hypothetical protein